MDIAGLETGHRRVFTYYEKTLVFDPAWVDETSHFLLFWDARTLQPCLYPSTMAGRRFRKTDDVIALELFEAWLETGRDACTAPVMLRRLATYCGTHAEMTSAERHEKHVRARGVPYRGAAPASPLFVSGHCGHCADAAGGPAQLACLACQGLVCICGTCDCTKSHTQSGVDNTAT